MVPLTSEYVDTSTTARQGTGNREPGGGLRSPAGSAPPSAERGSRWQRFRENVWSPVVLKAGGACLGLSCLALAGAVSMRQPSGGIEVSAQGTEWLAGASETDTASHASHGGTSRAGHGPSTGAPAGAAIALAPAPAGDTKAHADGPEGARVPCAEGAPKKESKGSGVAADGRIILNVADIQELTRLPGVGERRAEQIIALRERLGRFRRVTDLLRVKGIGPKSLRRLTPLLMLDPPKEEVAPQPDGESAAEGAAKRAAEPAP